MENFSFHCVFKSRACVVMQHYQNNQWLDFVLCVLATENILNSPNWFLCVSDTLVYCSMHAVTRGTPTVAPSVPEMWIWEWQSEGWISFDAPTSIFYKPQTILKTSILTILKNNEWNLTVKQNVICMLQRLLFLVRKAWIKLFLAFQVRM